MSYGSKFACLLAAIFFSASVSATDLAILRNGFSIRHERREIINSNTRLYLPGKNAGYVDVPTSEIDHFENDPTPPPPAPGHPDEGANTANLNEVISSISGRHRLDPDLINSVIRAESGFNTRAVSRKGAQGLMQLMPDTASKLGVSNVFDAQANVEGGTRYLRELLERYNFDLIKALAAYNAGPQRVEQYHGVPPYYETHAYVARIVRDFNRRKLEEQKAAAAASGSSVKKSSSPRDFRPGQSLPRQKPDPATP